jgi:hypothetical protein
MHKKDNQTQPIKVTTFKVVWEFGFNKLEFYKSKPDNSQDCILKNNF